MGEIPLNKVQGFLKEPEIWKVAAGLGLDIDDLEEVPGFRKGLQGGWWGKGNGDDADAEESRHRHVEGESCRECKGNGFTKCPKCSGDGGWHDENSYVTCPECKGDGGLTCPACDGYGKFESRQRRTESWASNERMESGPNSEVVAALKKYGFKVGPKEFNGKKCVAVRVVDGDDVFQANKIAGGGGERVYDDEILRFVVFPEMPWDVKESRRRPPVSAPRQR